MTNDEAQKPKYDLDLDAADIEVQLADGTKPRRFGKGPSIGEIIELGKKDPATITPTQKKQLEEANETMGKFVERMAPSLASFGDMARRITESVRVPDFSRQMTEVSLPPIIPPASGVEQHKQTMLLQRLVETFEAQTAERDADLHQAIQPRYDAQKRLLIFSNTLIEIPENTDQENLCQVLFRAGRPVKKPVELLRQNMTICEPNGALSKRTTRKN